MYLFIVGRAGSSGLHGLSLVAVSRGCSLAVGQRPLAVGASLVAERELSAHGLHSKASRLALKQSVQSSLRM